MSFVAPVIDPENDVKIDEHDLAKEFRQIASVIFRYSVARLEAQAELEEVRDVYKRAKAEKLLELVAKHPKATAKIIESHLELDVNLKMFEKQIRISENDLKYVEATIDALKIKEKMIMQLGADARRS